MNMLKWIIAGLLIIGCGEGKDQTPEPLGENNLAYRWGKVALELTANDTERFRPRPTVTSRMLALVWTAIFDAWSRYDEKAEPIYLEKVERRPREEWTTKNKETAISYAAYRTLGEYYYSDSLLLKNRMKAFGFDPDDRSMDPTSAVGIGNLASLYLIENRRHDGSNQTGTIQGSDGTPYSDYTGYNPVNNPDLSTNVIRWQPKYFSDGTGGRFAPACLTPHWQKVSPLLLDSANQFRCPPPPPLQSDQLRKEVTEVVEMQANLTDEQKALVEFMRDGPRSVQQAGHWLLFAQNVSVRDQHKLDDDVKMYFLVSAAAMDGFIACWDTKMHYDYARPFALVHHFFKDKEIKGWGGPGKGIIKMQGQDWKPYSPETFLCPPFPSYVSGHSTVSGACSEVLKLFKGNDFFGEEEKRIPGELTDPEHTGNQVILKLSTFSETAEMAGISRVLGGYHIPCENREGLILGRKVAAEIWKKYSGLIGKNDRL